MKDITDQKGFIELIDFLKQKRGFDFTEYKPASLGRRIQKRMQLVNINDYAEYIDFLEVHQDEFTLLFNTILINVTGFFRDADAWEIIRQTVIPEILQRKRSSEMIRLWSTGCASGEEAYTAAILLAEALSEEQYRDRVKIYGTDVDEEALTRARQAVYTAREVEGIPEELRQKYFTESGGMYVFNKDLRRNMIFGRNDILQDAPISRIDLLICRNTLMYFNIEAQMKILARFHFGLNDSGYLFLGKAESLLSHNPAFVPVDLKKRIFQKAPEVNQRQRTLLMNGIGMDDGQQLVISHLRLREAALETFPLPVIILDQNNRLVSANDAANQLLNLSGRDHGRPFQDLEISFRPIELRSHIQRAILEKTPVIVQEVPFHRPSRSEAAFYNIRLQPLFDTGGRLIGVCINFLDETQHRLLQQELLRSNSELETALEELQSTNEELETTNEELQSTIEELETTNEELQSTNEELETMNEELQSTNEELNTMNEELRLRTDHLDQANYFLDSILTSLPMGVIVLDAQMQVQAWNSKSADLWGLREEEVKGQSLFFLDIGLPVEQLKKTLQNCQSREAAPCIVELDATNRRGKPIRCRVSCSPFISRSQQVQGVIILVDEIEPGSL